MTLRSAHKSLQRVTSRGLAGPWKRYTMRGGRGSLRWKTTGIMKNQVGVDERIVLEAFSSRSCPDIFIRVYCEEPLKMHYARRVISPSQVDECMIEAAGIYDNIRGEEFKGHGLLGSVFNIIFRGILDPIPPPMDLDDIEVYPGIQKDTEQAAPRNH